MNHEVLDVWQRQALESSIELIEAGPGAGKTRTVIERMRQQQSSSKHAVALISFTNIAADEAKRRCDRGMLAFPHYVGTLDAFLHRYLVTPSFVRMRREAPRYVMSWNDLPEAASVIRIREVPGQGVHLGAFTLSPDGSITLPDNIPYQDRAYVGSVTKKGHRDRLVERGAKSIQSLINKGILDSDAARLMALQILEDEDDPGARRLATRFDEIIVDEFQDCSEVEVRIVRALKKLGIHVVTVADPDQAIYEFRDASPESYRKFREGLPTETVVSLEISYRSTPAICTFISSLKSVSATKIRSNSPTDNRRIIVAVGTPARQREIFREQLGRHAIAQNESMILAHRRTAAREIAGQEVPSNAVNNSSSKTFAILRSIMELRDGKTTKARKDAIARCERALLALMDWSEAEKRLSHAEQMELVGIERTDIVAFQLELQRESMEWDNAEESTRAIREKITRHFAQKEPGIRSVNRSVVKLKPDHWDYWNNCKNISEAKSILPYSHIHAVKGKEYRAIMLSVEKPRGEVAFWDMPPDASTTEAVRVLYVGASRAQELLVLACNAADSEALAKYLCQAAVPFEIVSY